MSIPTLPAATILTLMLALPAAAQTAAETTPAPPAPDAAGAGAGAAVATSGAQPEAPAQQEGAAPAETAADPATPAAGESAGTTATPPAAGSGPDTVPVTFENGRWYNAEGIPTFKIENGVVDYATFQGYRRYHAECHVCHGPDGEGSTYAPPLKDSVAHKIDYYEYQEVVASGKQDVGAASTLVMPALGTNRNVWCYVDDIYVYLLARGLGELPRGRPAEKAPKSDDYAAAEQSCMEG